MLNKGWLFWLGVSGRRFRVLELNFVVVALEQLMYRIIHSWEQVASS